MTLRFMVGQVERKAKSHFIPIRYNYHQKNCFEEIRITEHVDNILYRSVNIVMEKIRFHFFQATCYTNKAQQ